MKKKEIITLFDTAAMCGVSPQTVKHWVNHEGLSCIEKGGRGKNWSFDKETVLLWYSINKKNTKADESFEDGRRRKIIAEATLAEIQVDVTKGELVKIGDVSKTVEQEYSVVRTKMLSIASKSAPQLFQSTTLEEVQTLLLNEINQALSELSADEKYQIK